tara:strand:+ start:340 stop:507 length:168 start_codon:yes stop_codon:yes gene_type:complete
MDKSKTKSSKQKMLQVPVDVEWFDDLKEQADKNKRSLPNQVKIYLEPHIKLKKAK